MVSPTAQQRQQQHSTSTTVVETPTLLHEVIEVTTTTTTIERIIDTHHSEKSEFEYGICPETGQPCNCTRQRWETVREYKTLRNKVWRER